jgi:hypothetical protein
MRPHIVVVKVEANAQLQRVAYQLCLYRQSTPHRDNRTCELSQKAIARYLHIFGSMTFRRRSCT